MKNLHSHSFTSFPQASYVFKTSKNTKNNVDTHEKISSSARKVTDAPFQAIDYVSDKVHNGVETVLAHVPVVGKPLSYIPTLSKRVVKGGVNAAKNITGGVVEAVSQKTSHVVAGTAKATGKVAKGTYEGGKSLVTGKGGNSEREKKDLDHGRRVRAKVTQKQKARAERRKAAAHKNKAQKAAKAAKKTK